MYKKIWILFVSSLIICQVYSQTDKSFTRPAFELKLSVDDKQIYNAPMGETKFIINDSIIQIFPGEKLYIEADLIDYTLKNLRLVKKINDKTKTIVIDFEQITKGKFHEQMMLTIDNPFDKPLYYTAMMNLMKNKQWVSTSVYPVMPKLKAIEMWPDIITSIAIVGFKLKDE